MANNENYPQSSMLVASLGWIFLVIAVGVFLLVVQPYYFDRGYQLGKYEQLQEDIKIVDNYFGGDLPSDAPIVGQITSISDSSFVIEVEPTIQNPLIDRSGDMKTILVDEATDIQVGRYLGPEEYDARVREAEARGQSPETVSPIVEGTGLFTNLEVGQNVSVTPALDQDRFDDPVNARMIRLIIYTDASGNPFTPPQFQPEEE